MKCIIFGTGSIGKRLISILKSIDAGIEILSYKTSKEGIDVLEEMGVKVFFDIDEAFAQKPDFAVIANPTSLHVEYAIKAAEHGCDLFIEKPISDRLDGIESLKKIVKDKKLIAFVAYCLRFSKPFIEMKSIIQSRKLGKILSAEVHVGSSLEERHIKHHDWDYRKSYAAKKELGGGVALDLSHEIDYARWLFGELEVKNAFVGRKSDLKIDTDDTCDINAITKDGAKIDIHLDYIENPARRYCRIICEKGSISWNKDSGKVSVVQDGKTEDIDTTEDYNAMYRKEMDHFLDCIRKRKQTSIPIDEGVNTLNVVLKAKETSGWS